jgi:hypothetical protein
VVQHGSIKAVVKPSGCTDVCIPFLIHGVIANGDRIGWNNVNYHRLFRGGVEELLTTWPTRSYLKAKEEEFVLLQISSMSWGHPVWFPSLPLPSCAGNTCASAEG